MPARPAQGSARGAPETVVRPARANDADKIGSFFVRAWKQAGPGALGFAGATDEAVEIIASPEFLERRLASPSTRMVIAERPGEVVGLASVRSLGNGEAELSGMVVLQGATGSGVGTRLLRKACDFATKLGARNLTVKTEVDNLGAIGFYKKNGFTEAGKVTQKVGRSRATIQVMERRLPSKRA